MEKLQQPFNVGQLTCRLGHVGLLTSRLRRVGRRLDRWDSYIVAVQLWAWTFTFSDFLACHHEVVGDRRTYATVLFVVRVARDEFPHPSRGREDFTPCPLQNEVQVALQANADNGVAPYEVKVYLAKGNQAWKIVRAAKDFAKRHLCGHIRSLRSHPFLPLVVHAWRKNVPAKPKLFLRTSLAPLSDTHVLLHLRNRNVERQVQNENDTRQQHDKHCERRILEVGDLQLHAAELNAPTDVVLGCSGEDALVRRRRLPTHRLPVGALQILEVVDVDPVVQVDAVLVDHERVAREKVRDMTRQDLVAAAVDQALHMRIRQ
mmetsp:Transcript_2084/g.5073  ORF Transcript_2084/g.5073 Transcript_2084/m.5073 type:complete len:318 (-) Transcript_2084:1193-2146(-)